MFKIILNTIIPAARTLIKKPILGNIIGLIRVVSLRFDKVN